MEQPTDEILLFLVPRDGSTPDALASALRGVLPDAALASIAPADALPSLAHAVGQAAALPDIIVTLAARDRDGADPGGLQPPWQAIVDLVDPRRSSLLVVRRHAVLPGNDHIQLFFGLRRLPHLSLAGFHDYWLNRHADLGRRLIPPYSYHQLHADPLATARIAALAGLPASTLDGVVEVHFPDLATFAAQLSRPEVAEEALADERNFIDHSRSIFWAYRTLT